MKPTAVLLLIVVAVIALCLTWRTLLVLLAALIGLPLFIGLAFLLGVLKTGRV